MSHECEVAHQEEAGASVENSCVEVSNLTCDRQQPVTRRVDEPHRPAVTTNLVALIDLNRFRVGGHPKGAMRQPTMSVKVSI